MQGSENKRLEVICLAQDFHTLRNWNWNFNTTGTGQTLRQIKRDWPEYDTRLRDEKKLSCYIYQTRCSLRYKWFSSTPKMTTMKTTQKNTTTIKTTTTDTTRTNMSTTKVTKVKKNIMIFWDLLGSYKPLVSYVSHKMKEKIRFENYFPLFSLKSEKCSVFSRSKQQVETSFDRNSN